MSETETRSTELAAIMFTDIAEYSRMMEEDEERTIGVLKRHNEIVLPLIEAADGEVIDAIGDGLFVLFQSVRSAVTCATSLQDAVTLAGRDVPSEERFRLRIGIHLGEIWRDSGRVYGNGVNIAARVQPFARPGGVCITEDVYRQVGNNLGLNLTSIGAKELKNISRKVELFELETGNEDPARGTAAERASHEKPREALREFDRVKERLIAEKEKMAHRHAADGGDSLERTIESKVFSLVEHVMDRAISKWEGLPDEKKDTIIGKIEDGLSEAGVDGDVQISLGGGRSAARRAEAAEKKRRKAKKDAVENVSVGLVFGTAFGLGYFSFGIGWMVWPMILVGVLPLLSGLRKMRRIASDAGKERAERPKVIERKILALARELGGTVTVVQLASRTELELDEVQDVLDRLTARGYVTQHARGSVVEYEFPGLGLE
ncbi:MAG: adenylate/guanylate cyclase domain-containing protein [Spirochaetaceae bacterium]|nr:MAG: adenylate/guanylate cyclase domain-containing protein [Spirochaetaceae bacterium]